jgi:hypothetical protein
MNDNLTREIYCTNVIDSGSGFAIDAMTGEQVYIPVSVTAAADLQIGDTVRAILIHNSNDKSERTPWLAVRILRDDVEVTPTKPEPVKRTVPEISEETVIERVEAAMRMGGVWGQGDMFETLFPNVDRQDHISLYNRVGYAMRRMYDREECAKFSMWRNATQVKPGREWYTCYPDAVWLHMGATD